MDLKRLLKPYPVQVAPSVAPLSRARAENNTTPKATRVRFTDEQWSKLERRAQSRGVSIAQVVRDLVDAAK